MRIPTGILHPALFLSIFSASPMQAETVRLKSGAMGNMSFAVFGAPAKTEDQPSGNMIELKITLGPHATHKPETDARSLCVLFGTSSYDVIRTSDMVHNAMTDLVDLDAPLSLVRVNFAHYVKGPISVTTHYDFDMRGVVTCKPLR